MDIIKEDTSALTATLRVKLTPADYNPGLERALKEQRRQAVLPGFRPGQVPMGLIKKRVGKALLVNEVERLVDEHLRSYLQTNALRVLGQPLPKSDEAAGNDWENPGEFEFVYELGLAPVFDVELDKVEAELPLVEVTDELVDREVADILRRHGRMEEAASSGEKDMLIGDMIELDERGAVKEGGILRRATISLEYLQDEPTREALTGKAVGEEVEVDPRKVSSDAEDLGAMLGIDRERAAQLQGMFRFRITEIKRLVPAELGKALFDRLYGAGAVSDEAAFRAKVREGIEAMFRRDGERLFRKQVLDALRAQARIDLPEAFLKRWMLATSEKPTTPEEVEQGFASYAEALKRRLVEDRVVEKYGLEAKPEEIEGYAMAYVAGQFTQYGLPAPEPERLRELAARMLGDRQQVQRLRDQVVQQKLLVHFRAFLEPKERRMSLDEFITLARSV
ncbi:MAG: trigger factor [Flavobacteriales bacterium]